MLHKYCQYLIGFLIGTNIYIALVATTIAFSGFIIFHTSNICVSSLFVFFATQTAYNLHRFFKWRKNIIHPFLIPYIPKKKSVWIILMTIGFSICCYLVFLLSFIQLQLIFGFAIITSLYLFINPISKKLTGLRYIPFLKTFIVAGTWTGLFFILTFQENYLETLQLTWIYWLIVFLEIWQACILFDLRDVEIDAGHVKTLANTLNIRGVFIFWTIISTVILFYSTSEINFLPIIPIYCCIAIIQLYCLFKKPHPLLFTFLVDGSLMVFALLNYFIC